MEAAIFDDLTALADATRSRMLLVLERHELTVLGALRGPAAAAIDRQPPSQDACWTRSGSRRAAMARAATTRWRSTTAGPATRRLWALLREQVSLTPGADQDARRLTRRPRPPAEQVAGVLRVRRWPVGPPARGSLRRRVAICTRCPGCSTTEWVVGDLGCGTGQGAATLAPFVTQVIAVDRSSDMLEAARRRVRDLPNVDVRRGELEALPIAGRRARCRDAPPRAAPSAGSRRRRWPRPRACCGRAAGCSSPTCCRTTARRIVSRWGTSGSDSVTTPIQKLLGRRRVRSGTDRRDARRSGGEGTSAVRRGRDASARLRKSEVCTVEV